MFFHFTNHNIDMLRWTRKNCFQAHVFEYVSGMLDQKHI